MKENRSLVVNNAELANVSCSRGAKVTKVVYLYFQVSGDEHCVV